jgi:hypothetical protein
MFDDLTHCLLLVAEELAPRTQVAPRATSTKQGIRQRQHDTVLSTGSWPPLRQRSRFAYSSRMNRARNYLNDIARFRDHGCTKHSWAFYLGAPLSPGRPNSSISQNENTGAYGRRKSSNSSLTAAALS